MRSFTLLFICVVVVRRGHFQHPCYHWLSEVFKWILVKEGNSCINKWVIVMSDLRGEEMRVVPWVYWSNWTSFIKVFWEREWKLAIIICLGLYKVFNIKILMLCLLINFFLNFVINIWNYLFRNVLLQDVYPSSWAQRKPWRWYNVIRIYPWPNNPLGRLFFSKDAVLLLWEL